MKKIFQLAKLSAFALVGIVGFAACSSDENEVPNNPTFDGETVKTQFTISFTQNVQGKTKMAQDIVQGQASPVFRGMENIVLIPFDKAGAIEANDTRFGTNIQLPNGQGTANTLAASDLVENNNSHIYSDVLIPVGTQSFLFYGKAVDASVNTAISTDAEYQKYGTLEVAGLTNDSPSAINFSHKSIYQGPSTIGPKLVDYLNSIAHVTTNESPAREWGEVPATDNQAMYDLFQTLIALRAGSSNSIQAALEDICTSIYAVSLTPSPVAKAIIDAITAQATLNVDDPTAPKLTLNDDLQGYPQDINLPDGAATILWNGSDFVQTTYQSNTISTPDTRTTNLIAYLNKVINSNGWKKWRARYNTYANNTKLNTQAAVQTLYTAAMGEGDAFSAEVIAAILTSGVTDDGTGTLDFGTLAEGTTEWATYRESIKNVKGWKTLANQYSTYKAQTDGTPEAILAATQALYDAVSPLDDSAIKTAILENIASNGVATTGGTVTFPAAMTNYDRETPYTVQIAFDGSNFVLNNYAQQLSIASLDRYVYPANLYYRANSRIKTSDVSEAEHYVSAAPDWTTILSEYANDNAAVSAKTRSVAIKDQIEYAVARLDATVKAGDATLYDRNGDAVNGDAGTRFPMTGILIGGQKAVDFEFKTDETATAYTIYDNITKSQAGTNLYASTGGSGTNYTLALQSEKNQPIYIAVELVNNSGQDFRGYDGIVPNGGTFYLVAQLDPTAGTGYDNATEGLDRVFTQDYTTTVNLTIAAGTAGDPNNKGLGAAYNTLPDLRTPALELGLSVNLTWKSGLQFNQEI